MTRTHNPRTSSALRRYADANKASSQPVVERLLHFIGADLAFADDVLGDLAEERARRAARDGARFASWWYAREACRSAPHLAWNAVLHGGARGRAHVAAIVAAMALLLTVAVVVLNGGEPVAVRLEVDGQRTANASDGVIVNTRHPVLLAMRALDAKGMPLSSTGVRYRWMSGAPISVSANGVITCSYAGDALLRASLGAVATTVRIKCLPVREVLAHMWIQFTAGDSSQELSFVALDPDGLPVNRLAGVLRVKDSTIAMLKKGRIYPLSPGHTQVVMRFGDGAATTQISVYERVATFEGLRDDQRLVIAPVRLAPGDTIRWPLPKGLFWLQYHRESEYSQMPTLAVDGPVVCMPAFGPSVERVDCLVRGAGASVRIMHSGAAPSALADASCEICRSSDVIAQRRAAGNRTFAAPYVQGALSLEQQKYP
jgi:hypothetical protein